MSDVLLESTSQRRVRLLARIAFGWSALLLLRLVYLQVLAHGDLAGQAEDQQTRIITEAPARGAILDRNESPLAFSRSTDSVAVDPRRIKNVEMAVSIFSSVLGLDAKKLREEIEAHKTKNRGHLVIQRGITQAQVQRLLQWQHGVKVDFIQIYSDTLRDYPEGSLAAHLLGGTDHRQWGYAGLEAALNDDLQGVEGQKLVHVDGRSRGFDSEELSSAEVGSSIVTTIDRAIQFEAERILGEAMKSCRCDHASVVVMNPHTGEIYAFAVAPGFDINKKIEHEAEIQKVRRNRAVEEPYEPGSVFKIVTAAAALDMRKVTAETPIPCPPQVRVSGRKTPLSNGHGGGIHPVKEVVAQSSNTGTYYMAANLVGRENLHRYIKAFGFGTRTGIELPFETAGTVKPLRLWKAPTVAMAAMGYEVSATTVQLAQAGAIIANGGRRVKPTLLRHRVRGARVLSVATQEAEQVLRPETAIAMRNILEWVVLSPHGTGRKAKLDGWSSAGKTGTAYRIDPRTKNYQKTWKNSSFVGFAPVNNPAIVVAVSLHNTSQDASEVAAPVFRQVAMKALPLLGVPQDVPTRVLADEDAVASARAEAGDVELEEATDEEENDAQAAEPLEVGSVVPDFRGKTMKEVSRVSREARLNVDPVGSGIARSQQPRPGARLKPGERIRVVFAR